jgi:hypothetical protein
LGFELRMPARAHASHVLEWQHGSMTASCRTSHMGTQTCVGMQTCAASRQTNRGSMHPHTPSEFVDRVGSGASPVCRRRMAEAAPAALRLAATAREQQKPSRARTHSVTPHPATHSATHTQPHTHTATRTRTHAHTHAHTCTHTCTHTRTHTRRRRRHVPF